jgi:hypothetical protein
MSIDIHKEKITIWYASIDSIQLYGLGRYVTPAQHFLTGSLLCAHVVQIFHWHSELCLLLFHSKSSYVRSRVTSLKSLQGRQKRRNALGYAWCAFALLFAFINNCKNTNIFSCFLFIPFSLQIVANRK